MNAQVGNMNAAGLPQPGVVAPNPNAGAFQSASLYVGDLQPEVTESLLYELFNSVGPVASIRVCRDTTTRQSLGYAYVNFHNVQDAERALDTMNFKEIKGKPCRLMWSQRDPSLRRSGVGNIIVRNLPKSVDNQALFDTFSVAGNILSCKVVTDENEVSKGYGYVHFETAEAAQDAIQKFNGSPFEDKILDVEIFVKRQERSGNNDWTNVYVKHYPSSWEEANIRSIFEPFGVIQSIYVSLDKEGKKKGVTFVNFAEHDSADKAVVELNGKVMEDGQGGTFELYVARFQNKAERTRENKSKADHKKQERDAKYLGMNLYVKNIAESVTDEQLRELFVPFGTITSACIMKDKDSSASKGFGFICFSSPEEASRALAEMNGKSVEGKPLVVNLHQKKEHRKAHLEATYAPQMRNFPAVGQPGMPLNPYMGVYLNAPGGPPFPAQPRPGMVFSFPGPPGAMSGRGPAGGMTRPMAGAFPRPGFAPFPTQYIPGAAPLQGGPQQFPKNRGMQGPQQGGFPGMATGGMPGPRGVPVRGPAGPQPGMPMQGARGPIPMAAGRSMQGFPVPAMGPGMQPNMRGQVKFNNQVRNPQAPSGPMIPGTVMVPPMMQQAPQVSHGGEFSDTVLANVDPQTQKNMIGERLYPLIREHQPEQAGKITGMLLEMDNGELLNLIESPDALMAKIEEALNVLRNHKAEE